MKKPIILHITPSLMVGGAEKLLVDLLTNFQNNPANEFEHQVIYFQAGPFLNQLEKLNIKIYHVTGLLNYYDPICFLKLLLLTRKIGAYKIHSMLWSANFYARLVGKILKIPVICAIHSYYNSGNHTQDNLFKLKLDMLTLNWAKIIITVSSQIAKKLSSPKYRLTPNQIKIIHNGVKIPNQPNHTKQSILNNNSVFTIGHVGRLVPVKNQALLIMALGLIKAKVKNFKVIIIGSGEMEQSLKKLAHNLDLNHQISFIKTNQPWEYFPKFDCFVLPSHQEGQSIALLEAMSFGITPVVTAPNNQHEIVVNCHNGLICEPNHHFALAQAMLELANQPKFNRQLAINAQITIQKQFNLNQTANLYLNTYKLS